jgi:hypothetical protein
MPTKKRSLGTQSGQADNLHPNVETPQAAANGGFAPRPLPPPSRCKCEPQSQPGPQNTGPHRLPCHDKAGQRRPGRRSACTHPASGLWLTPAQRKRTDDDESPLPWLWLLLASEIEPLASGRGRAPRPKGGTGTHSVSHPARPRARWRSQGQGGNGDKKIGAPLRCVVGAPSIKRGDASESLTTLHTTPHHPELSPIPSALAARLL